MQILTPNNNVHLKISFYLKALPPQYGRLEWTIGRLRIVYSQDDKEQPYFNYFNLKWNLKFILMR